METFHESKPLPAALKKAAKDAIDCQNACNLSGVAGTLVNATKAIWAEVNAGRLSGTDDVNHHPIVKLIVNKLASLSGSEDGYMQAYEDCQAICDAPTLEEPEEERKPYPFAT